jgi:hypothetical protein
VNFLPLIKSKIAPRQFSRGCLLISALTLIFVYPGMLWFFPNKLPNVMKPSLHIDFYQYYAGGLVVRHGIWDSLYPIPKPDIYDKPNHFVPKYQTFLFDPSTARTNPAYYPELNTPDDSDCAPKLTAYFPEINYHFRYIYPPPTALFLWPLSYVGFDTAVDRVWPTICIWSLFALSVFASRIHRLFRQGDSYTEGLVVLACVIFACRGQTQINVGNVSPILAGLIAFCCHALMRGRRFAFSCAYVPLLLFKTIGLAWLPLFLINRAYWRVLIYLGMITALLNGIVIYLAGLGVYQTFFSLVPKIGIPLGQGIVPGLLNLYGFYPRTLYFVIYLGCVALLYYGYWKNAVSSPRESTDRNGPLFGVALFAGTMALFCILNLTIWLPYCSNYLFFPFLGWILQEGYLASGYWRYFILGGTICSFLVLIGKGIWFFFFGLSSVAWYSNAVLLPSCVFFIPVFFLIISLRRLLFIGGTQV